MVERWEANDVVWPAAEWSGELVGKGRRWPTEQKGRAVIGEGCSMANCRTGWRDGRRKTTSLLGKWIGRCSPEEVVKIIVERSQAKGGRRLKVN